MLQASVSPNQEAKAQNSTEPGTVNIISVCGEPAAPAPPDELPVFDLRPYLEVPLLSTLSTEAMTQTCTSSLNSVKLQIAMMRVEASSCRASMSVEQDARYNGPPVKSA